MTTSIGVTGHINLTPATRALVAREIAAVLADHEAPVTGWTSLAAGADQVFAWSVVAAGGGLVFVQPCDSVEQTLPAEALEAFRASRALADETVAMPYEEPSNEAYFAAGAHIADHVDLLLAVWDGRPSAGWGGTGDIVERRRAAGRPVTVIWPPGAARLTT